MLIEEAKWFGRTLATLNPNTTFPMLNIGSSTTGFRQIDQPWINQYIFEPLQKAKYPVVHTDIKTAQGVDIVGDLTDPNFLSHLQNLSFKSVFCSNLLEHITDRQEICSVIQKIVPTDGYIFLSCPYRYPYHADPIDTMFRPSVADLQALFPNTSLRQGAIVTCKTYSGYLTRTPKFFLKMNFRLLAPFYKPKDWFTLFNHYLWLFRHFQATCVVLQKNA